MITHDTTQHSVVTLCSDCPGWRAVTTTKQDAWAQASTHEAQCHPGGTRARDAARHHARRAETSPTVFRAS